MSAPNLDGLEQRAERLVEDRDGLMDSLIQLRREHKLTQKEIAERMGVSQPTVAAFEHYDSNPTLATVQRYAMAVGAVLDTHVIDDCGEGLPSGWSDRIERNVRLRSPQRAPATVRFRALSYV